MCIVCILEGSVFNRSIWVVSKSPLVRRKMISISRHSLSYMLTSQKICFKKFETEYNSHSNPHARFNM